MRPSSSRLPTQRIKPRARRRSRQFPFVPRERIKELREFVRHAKGAGLTRRETRIAIERLSERDTLIPLVAEALYHQSLARLHVERAMVIASSKVRPRGELIARLTAS